MEFTREQTDPIRKLLTRDGTTPPAPVLLAIASTFGREVVTHAHSEQGQKDGTTTWQVIALSDSRIVWLEMSKNEADWDLGSNHHERFGSFTTWSAPLRHLRSVDLHDMRVYVDGNSWTMDAVYEVVVGKRSFKLPLSGAFSTYRNEEEVDGIVARLKEVPWSEDDAAV